MSDEWKEKGNMTSAAEVNLMKAEEYRESLRTGRNREKKQKSGKKIALLVAGAAITGILAASIFQGVNWYRAEEGNSAVGKESISELDAQPSGVLPVQIPEQATGAEVFDVSNVVENVMPAVVAISCDVETVRTSYDFFGHGYEQKERGSASGTGIIISQSESELLIVTNNHVIEDAVQVTIEFCDKTTAPAQVKGAEEGDDLAVVSVQLKD
ncbi:MAG: S1C family serine protease, partial [Lachnospiraceae bacterium]|nr:S1C family serine protease [Lachnospiraceae bacterium]